MKVGDGACKGILWIGSFNKLLLVLYGNVISNFLNYNIVAYDLF